MRIKKHNFIPAVGIAVLCCAVFGEVEVPPSEGPVLLDRPNPALGQIEKVFVSVAASVAEPNDEGRVYEGLEAKVIERLKSAGIEARPIFYVGKRVEYGGPHAADFTVNINGLRLADSQQYVFCIDSSLARDMILPVDRGLRIRTEVWKTEAVMEAAAAQDANKVVTEATLHQVEAFITCFLVANPKCLPPADSNAAGTLSESDSNSAAKQGVTGYAYLASKNSKVFHKSDCPSAGRIEPKNLVGYASREEAIKAGRRPCKRCKP